jgi:hypothetical protein
LSARVALSGSRPDSEAGPIALIPSSPPPPPPKDNRRISFDTRAGQLPTSSVACCAFQSALDRLPLRLLLLEPELSRERERERECECDRVAVVPEPGVELLRVAGVYTPSEKLGRLVNICWACSRFE